MFVAEVARLPFGPQSRKSGDFRYEKLKSAEEYLIYRVPETAEATGMCTAW
jgi:hypothetical protein